MKALRKHLEKLRKVEKRKYHPLIHKLHGKHRISRRTLFYVKEYGQHANVTKTIIKESIKILLLASIVSSFGGLAFESIKPVFVSLIPLIILLPTLNGMIGSYGIIVSSRFSSMLYEGRVKGKWRKNEELEKLFVQIFVISIFTALLCTASAIIISVVSNYAISTIIASKIFFVVLMDVILLVNILFLVSIVAGLYFYRKGEDPNNFLIPITTSIADFGNMIILAVLIILIF